MRWSEILTQEIGAVCKLQLDILNQNTKEFKVLKLQLNILNKSSSQTYAGINEQKSDFVSLLSMDLFYLFF